MSKGGSTPKAPDPRVVANAQTQQNQQTAGYNAALNRTNVYGPSGSSQFTNTGIDPATGAPQYRQDIQLDPQLEQQYRAQLGQNDQLTQAGQGLTSQISNQQPFSLGGLPDLPTNYDDLRKSQADSLYKANTAFLDPQFKQGEDALRSRMANQGIVEGSEAANNAMGDFSRAKEFSYGQARDKAISGAGQEADRAFGMNSAARNQMMSEMLTQHQMPYQDLANIRNMTQFQMPEAQGNPQQSTAPADITSAMNNQYQGQVDTYNQKQQQKNQNMQAAASIAAMFMLSDERAKDNIEPVGELRDGTPLFSYNYKGSDTPQVGVMAQEVEKRDPAAVRIRPDGLKEVDYRRVLSRALAA